MKVTSHNLFNIHAFPLCIITKLTNKTVSTDDLPTASKPSYDLNYSPSINSNALPNVANSLHFTPVTPDQATNMEKRQSAILKSTIDESTSQERDKTKNLVEYTGHEATQQHHDELLQNIVDSSSNIVPTPYEEKKDSDKISDLGFDLNKTPQQKPPKRRKHRPKVIVEGKQKRGRKPAIPKITEPKENQPGKRKYVRKNVQKDSTAQVVDISETREPTVPQKSCKRVLNFVLEKTEDESQGSIGAQKEVQMNGNTQNVPLDYQATELCYGTNHARGTISSMQSDMPSRSIVENHIMNLMSNGNVSQLDRQAAVAPLDSIKDRQMKILNATGRLEINRNVYQQQKRKEDEYILRQQHNAKGIVQDSTEGKDNCENLEKIREPLKQHMPQQVPKTPSSQEARGSKREHCHTIQHARPSTTNHMDASALLYQGIYQICTGFSQTHKKKRIGDDYTDILNLPSNVKAAAGLGNVETTGAHDVHANGLKSKPDWAMLNTHFRRIAQRQSNEVSKFTGDTSVHAITSGHNSPKQQILSKQHSRTEQMGLARAFRQVNSLSTETTIKKSNHFIPSLPRISTGQGNDQTFQTHCYSMSEMKQTVRAPLIKSALSEVDTAQEPLPKKRGTFLV